MYFQDFSCKSKVARQIKLKKYFTNCTKFKSLTNWCNRLVILWIVSEVVSSTSYIRESIENRTFCTKHFVYVNSWKICTELYSLPLPKVVKIPKLNSFFNFFRDFVSYLTIRQFYFPPDAGGKQTKWKIAPTCGYPSGFRKHWHCAVGLQFSRQASDINKQETLRYMKNFSSLFSTLLRTGKRKVFWKMRI